MPPTLKKTQKIITENGKTKIVEDWQRALKSKPAGQQFWNTKKRRFKKPSAANINRTP